MIFSLTSSLHPPPLKLQTENLELTSGSIFFHKVLLHDVLLLNELYYLQVLGPIADHHELLLDVVVASHYNHVVHPLCFGPTMRRCSPLK